MPHPRKLSAKLVGIQVVFLAVALVSIGLTLLVSWRLEGSAAAINDAGSLRMRAYRLAYLAEEARNAERGERRRRRSSARTSRASRTWWPRCAAAIRCGRSSCRARPRSTGSSRRCARSGTALKPPLLATTAGGRQPVPRAQVEQFVGVVDDLVRMLERNIAEATSLLRGIQLALVALAVVGATALIYLSFLFIIRPVHQLEDGLARMARGDSQRAAHRRARRRVRGAGRRLQSHGRRDRGELPHAGIAGGREDALPRARRTAACRRSTT